MSGLRIIVLGYLVRGPIGGMAWHHLQYVLGLAACGHEVLYIEDSDDFPSCYDPKTDTVGTDPSYGIAFIDDAFDRLDLHGRWAFHDSHTRTWHGWQGDEIAAFAASCDLLINVSGVNPLLPCLMNVPVRIFIDTDPGFTQIKHLKSEKARQRAEGHTHFLTFAERIAAADCTIPGDGFKWRTTRQPVCLDQWPVTAPPAARPFTTVMQWDSYDAVRYGALELGMKSRSFDAIIDLPRHAPCTLELAVGSPTTPCEILEEAGWKLRDPLEVTRTPSSYRDYIQDSAGEFSVAKHGYVVTRSGWFSERSACYLASGRPAVVQDTGFSEFLPTGAGLWAFTGMDAALEALEACERDPAKQGKAAREIAEAHFDARKILPEMIERALTS